jgi:hypothetical protein
MREKKSIRLDKVEERPKRKKKKVTIDVADGTFLS